MHTFNNFKNFADAQLNLLRPFTLMIGRNGSGKSNAIEGVELLAQLAHGRPLHEITDIGRGGGSTFEIRGGLPGCSKNSASTEIATKFSLGFDAYWKHDFFYEITIGVSQQKAFIVYESLKWGNRFIFIAQTGKREDILDVQFDNFKKGGQKPITHLPSDRSVLSRYESFANIAGPIGQKQKDARKLVNILESHLNAAFVFDLNPKSMRDYERIDQRFLNKNGSNLSSVLYGFSQGDEIQKNTLQRILSTLRQLPEEPFDNFEFITTRLNDVLMALCRVDGTLADARLLSDGTLRALGILTALETVPEKSRIIIEEVDNGIHPSRAETLVNAIWECSTRRKLNVLATTHNPATLDCLNTEQLKCVVLCHHDPQSKTSKLTPLLDLPRAEILLERGSLGDLVTRKVIDQYLDPTFDEQQRRKARDWLASLS